MRASAFDVQLLFCVEVRGCEHLPRRDDVMTNMIACWCRDKYDCVCTSTLLHIWMKRMQRTLFHSP